MTEDRPLWVSIRESVDGNLIVKFGGGSRQQFFDVLAVLKDTIPVPERKFEEADKSWRVRASAFRLLLTWARDNFARDRIRLQFNDIERLKEESIRAHPVGETSRDRDASFGGQPTQAPVGDIGKLHQELREARRQIASLNESGTTLQQLYEEVREENRRLARQAMDSTRLSLENARLSRELNDLRRRPTNGHYGGSDADLAELHIVPGTHVTGALVKAFYRAACTIYHPDKGGSEAKMKAVNNAYDRLKRRYQIV
jgi:hypothetical protein